MAKRPRVSRARVAFAVVALAGGAYALADELPAPRVVRKFDHAAHRARGVKVTDSCATCHGAATDGTLAPPAKQGHQPCLQSGCHLLDFLGKADDPDKTAAFCAGCHPTADGKRPRHFTKPAVVNAYADNPVPSYHVAMNHFDHTKRAKCRDCHVVDDQTYGLKFDRPAHAECATCHGKTASPPMSACGNCHDEPGAAAYYKRDRKESEVRSCDSPGRARMSPERRAATPCFQHETKQHRFHDDGARLECGHCHFVVADKKFWKGGASYESLAELRAAPIIINTRDEAHAHCGVAGCHARDIHPSRGNCRTCHSQKTVDEGIFGK